MKYQRTQKMNRKDLNQEMYELRNLIRGDGHRATSSNPLYNDLVHVENIAAKDSSV